MKHICNMKCILHSIYYTLDSTYYISDITYDPLHITRHILNTHYMCTHRLWGEGEQEQQEVQSQTQHTKPFLLRPTPCCNLRSARQKKEKKGMVMSPCRLYISNVSCICVKPTVYIYMSHSCSLYMSHVYFQACSSSALY